MAKISTKNKLGQYFTTHNKLKEKVFEFILNNPSCILEPCIGQGDLILYVKNQTPDILFDMYEIDTKIKLLDGIEREKIIYGDFMKQTIEKKYLTIIGNPPYIRTKKGNMYIDFTEKCYDLLDDNGELIFIVPSDFLKLTCASKLLNKMMQHGSFTHIFHPHSEKMFENASIDVIVFRYCKNSLLEKSVMYNDKLLHIVNSDGLITFQCDSPIQNTSNDLLFKDCFDMYVGLVTGKEEVYKNEALGNIELLNGENKIDKYIYIENYPCENEKINEHLLKHKLELIERKIRKFDENNWFQWGAPRNIRAMSENAGKECIYVYNLTRKNDICFLGKVQYFGGGLIMLIPKKKIDLSKIASYMNSNEFKNNFMFSGRFKIGHRQISNSYVPNECL